MWTVALVRLGDAGDDVEERALARAVGADHGHLCAAIKLEADILQRRRITVEDADRLKDQRGSLAVVGYGPAEHCGHGEDVSLGLSGLLNLPQMFTAKKGSPSLHY